jgi:hypothetical protein
MSPHGCHLGSTRPGSGQTSLGCRLFSYAAKVAYSRRPRVFGSQLALALVGQRPSPCWLPGHERSEARGSRHVGEGRSLVYRHAADERTLGRQGATSRATKVGSHLGSRTCRQGFVPGPPGHFARRALAAESGVCMWVRASHLIGHSHWVDSPDLPWVPDSHWAARVLVTVFDLKD